MSRTSETVLVIPDSQNGFRGNQTLHDRGAWEAAVVLAQMVQPDYLVLLGDMLDFSTLTKKFRTEADLVGKMGHTIEETKWWLKRLVVASRGSKRKYLAGNHEARLNNTLVDANKDLEGLVTVSSLLELGEDYQYIGPYGRTWEHREVIYAHGDKYAKYGGQTCAKYLSEHPKSIVFGHCHKNEIARRTYYGRTRFAASPGTIARIDGIVPGNSCYPDWSQGFCLVHYSKGNDPACEMITYANRHIFMRGEVLPVRHDARARQKELGF